MPLWRVRVAESARWTPGVEAAGRLSGAALGGGACPPAARRPRRLPELCGRTGTSLSPSPHTSSEHSQPFGVRHLP